MGRASSATEGSVESITRLRKLQIEVMCVKRKMYLSVAINILFLVLIGVLI